MSRTRIGAARIAVDGLEPLQEVRGRRLLVVNRTAGTELALLRRCAPASWGPVLPPLLGGVLPQRTVAVHGSSRAHPAVLAPFDLGLLALARRLAAVVVPVGVSGALAAEMDPTAGVSVRFGAPTAPGAGESAPEFADRLHTAVADLLAEDASTWWQVLRHGPDGGGPESGWRATWSGSAPRVEGGRAPATPVWETGGPDA